MLDTQARRVTIRQAAVATQSHTHEHTHAHTHAHENAGTTGSPTALGDGYGGRREHGAGVGAHTKANRGRRQVTRREATKHAVSSVAGYRRGAFEAFLCVCTSVAVLSWDNVDTNQCPNVSLQGLRALLYWPAQSRDTRPAQLH